MFGLEPGLVVGVEGAVLVSVRVRARLRSRVRGGGVLEEVTVERRQVTLGTAW